MQRIELDDRTAENLINQAGARGMTVADYLKSLFPAAANGHDAGISFDELDAELDSLTLNLPTLPPDFSRADIYDEHD